MCRFLVLRAPEPFDPVPWIEPFAERCEASREYQGHGWGVSWWTGAGWERHRSVEPIWDEIPDRLPASTLVLVHARSAFRNEGIVVENNMPFLSGDLAFAFNGELHGVRLSVPGETGAARLFTLLERFRASCGGDLLSALERLDRVVTERSEHVRAMNMVVSDGRDVWVNAHFSQEPDYFTLWRAEVPGEGGGLLAVSSERFDTDSATPAWAPIPNRATLKLEEPWTP